MQANNKETKTGKYRKQVLAQYKALIFELWDYTTQEERHQIRKAFRFSSKAHADMIRKSGEPYILHPLAVARILTREIGLKERVSIISALIHDVVEDTHYEIADIEKEFGETVAKIVDGLTKIAKVDDPASSKQAETLRKMLLTMSDDVRVALVKIADRLHNMRTLESMKPATQLKIASETQQIYAPLAHKLGLYTIKVELEDLALKYIDPKIHQEITAKLKETESIRDKYIEEFISPIKQLLMEQGIHATILGRVKSAFSIYTKMKRQGVPFEEVFDLFAIRIIIEMPEVFTLQDEKEACWRVYSRLAELYKPHETRLRDWVNSPKPNGYESLHNTFLGKGGKWVEVQIRTRRMDEVADKGVAAHWKYKGGAAQSDDFERWLVRVREVLENKEMNAAEFMDQLKFNFANESIHVFTPKGEIKTLPKSSTVLDLAYEIHTDIGNTCIGAKVNHRLVQLSHVLINGDLVEIITSTKQKPEIKWEEYVKTPKAHSKIMEATREMRRKVAEEGKNIFEWKLKHLNLHKDDPFVKEFLKEFKLKNLQELYYVLGAHRIDVRKVVSFISGAKQKLKNKTKQTPTEANGKEVFDSNNLVIPESKHKSLFHYATCCNPIPGDEIVGVTNDFFGVFIHRRDCKEVINMATVDGKSIIYLQWGANSVVEFLTGIRIKGHDQLGMLINMLTVISKRHKINMSSLRFDVRGGQFDGLVTLYVYDTDELNNLIMSLKEVQGVFSVERTYEFDNLKTDTTLSEPQRRTS